MKILIAHAFSGIRKRTVELLKEKLQRQYQGAEVFVWDAANPATLENIRKAEADLFVDFNLLGFEQGTLAGSIAYNLLDCKQIHILLDNALPNEKQLEKQLSIAMFFYCVDAQYGKYLSEQYPELPYLKEAEGWKRTDMADDAEHNASLLCGITKEVLRICHMAH
ncbi:MAG: hypothetical protein K2I01_05235 [Lachnospiraceae bacterium]|nr:hypothetical protein [Lachnospiraceae bacterium]